MNGSNQFMAFVFHMRDEHRRLNDLLTQVGAAWPQGEGDPESNLGSCLSHLRGQLATHFAEEEDGGCLEEVACRRPSLGREVRRCEGEHAELLDDLDRLITQLAKEPSGPQRLRTAFDDFRSKLRRHEAEENRLLETAFGSSVEA